MASIFACLLIIILAPHLLCLTSASNGFSTKLIYRDSPLHHSNLSYIKSFWQDIKTSRNRASDLISFRKFKMDPSTILRGDSLQLSLFFREPLFSMEVGIGTPKAKARLVFDTAAPLTWMQCQLCLSCFKQDYPIFDPGKSSSIRIMPPNHTLAPWFNCTILECYYYLKTHGGGASSHGTVLTDHFSFLGKSEQLKDVIFGCGTHNYGSLSPQKTFSGILGIGNSPTSLVGQLGKRTMQRFSYCLPELRSSKTKRTDLSFGAAAMIKGGNVQTTPFLGRPQGTMLVQAGGYRVNLLGISVAGKRLEIPKGSFDGGCIIDTGAPFSIIEEQAYKAVLHAISSYFSQYQNIKQVVSRKYPKNLCYKCPRGFRNLPSMKLHFEGANLEINAPSLFMIGRSRFGSSDFICLQMLGEPKTNILGVYQQQNVRFLYDLGSNKLSFGREKC